MFDKFGPLTYDELNETAKGLKMEGDIESLILLAEENGLDKEDAEDYADGAMEPFVTSLEAAFGKIEVEAAVLKAERSTTLTGMKELIFQVLRNNKQLQIAARNPEKQLAECYGRLFAEASRTRFNLPAAITKAAGLPNVCIGDLTTERARVIIAEYYGGEEL